MKIINLGSSSSGNAFIVESNGNRILLECGFPYKDLLKKSGFNLPENCLVTHEHKDHSMSAKDLTKWGIQVWGSAGTIEAIGCGKVIPKKQWSENDGFQIYPFETEHDCAEPYGYFLASGEESVLFVTDTCYLRYIFDRLFTEKTYLMLECNFDRETLSETVDDRHLERVFNSHMSLQDLKLMLKANDLSKVEAIYLLHASQDNLDPHKAKKEIQELTGLPVYLCAKNGGFV